MRRIQAALIGAVVSAALALAAGAQSPNPPEKPDWNPSELPPNSRPNYRGDPTPYSSSYDSTSTSGESFDPSDGTHPPSARSAQELVHRYLEKRTDRQGYFTLNDPVQGRKWELKPVGADWSSFRWLEKERYSIMGDFETEDGERVRVEFTLKRSWLTGDWVVASPQVFSVNGVPRWAYKYNHDKRKWVRAPVLKDYF